MTIKRIAQALTLVCLVGCAGNYFTNEQLSRLRPGMTRDQVRQIMGKPNMQRIDATGGEVWIWSFAEGFTMSGRTASVVFTNGVAASVPPLMPTK